MTTGGEDADAPQSAAVRGTADAVASLRTSLLSLDVLKFGEARSVPTSSFSCGPGERVTCSVEIPIAGGLLANEASEQSPRSTAATMAAFSRVERQKHRRDLGCLRFTFIEVEGTNEKCGIVIVTEIAGKYRPSLAGSRLPVPAWRNAMYCSTQRLVHAYVMWRYHDFVVRELRNRIASAK